MDGLPGSLIYRIDSDCAIAYDLEMLVEGGPLRQRRLAPSAGSRRDDSVARITPQKWSN
jgi:hypothetical protein